MQPPMLREAPIPRPTRDRTRLVRMPEVVADQLEHLVAAPIARNLLTNDEVPREIRVERCEIQAAPGSRNLEVTGLHVRQIFGVADASHPEVDDAAVDD